MWRSVFVSPLPDPRFNDRDWSPLVRPALEDNIVAVHGQRCKPWSVISLYKLCHGRDLEAELFGAQVGAGRRDRGQMGSQRLPPPQPRRPDEGNMANGYGQPSSVGT